MTKNYNLSKNMSFKTINNIEHNNTNKKKQLPRTSHLCLKKITPCNMPSRNTHTFHT